MQKCLYSFILIVLAMMPLITHAGLETTLRGKILLQVEAHGEAWYVYPKDLKRYYLGRPADAFGIMRQLGLGILHSELQTYLNTAFPSRLSGMIMLDVEKNGEAYYVFPDDLNGYYLGRPADAFEMMRRKGLGITNSDLNSIPTADGDVSRPPSEILTTPGSLAPEPEGSGSNASILERRAFDLINNHRAAIGSKRLIWSDTIANEARRHSEAMAAGTVPSGHDGFYDRMNEIGKTLDYNGAAENLAWNNHEDPAQGALSWWLTSEGHRISLENDLYEMTGIGAIEADTGIYYFTQIFVNVD